jgi:predicted small lipoprotein YifL
MSRFALFGLFAVALALGACGRKGGLDAPPGGAASIGYKQDSPQTLTGQQQNSQSGNNVVGRSSTGLPRIQGEDRRIPLDAILN